MAAKRKNTKKNSLKGMSQTHGKVDKFEPTTLDQIWGDDGTGMYGTLDITSYENRLDDMNMSDMQTHASRVGIIPIDNRSMLRERLVREFRKHVSAYKKPTSAPEENPKISKEIEKILSEGR
tara:strand:- start:694 stop:1059 length:366 start_codon:yes stop_codon:yes gene_type:complete